MRLYFGKYPGQAPHHGDGLRNFWRSRSWTYIKGRLQKLRGSLGDHRRSYGYFDLEDACFSPMDGKNFLLYKCLSSFDASSWISWDGIYRLFGSSIYSCHYNIQVVSFINYHTNGSLYCQWYQIRGIDIVFDRCLCILLLGTTCKYMRTTFCTKNTCWTHYSIWMYVYLHIRCIYHGCTYALYIYDFPLSRHGMIPVPANQAPDEARLL